MKHGENLEKLVIADSCAVTAGELKDLKNFKMLRNLDLSGCDISLIGLMNVVNGSLGVQREVVISRRLGKDTDATRLAAKFGVKITPR